MNCRIEPLLAWWITILLSAIFWGALLSGMSCGQTPEPSPLAREERAITLLRRAEQHRRWRAWNEGTQPQVVFVQSLGAPAQAQVSAPQPIIIIINQAPAPSYVPQPRGFSGIPDCAGQLPPLWYACYGRMINAIGGN